MNGRNIPTVFVIFGATGDLMGKKIAPALFRLFEKEKLPKLFKIIGVARRPLSDENFKTHIKTLLKKHGIKDKAKLKNFLLYFSYYQGNFTNEKDYEDLAKILGMIDKQWRVCANKLFYLAVPPQYYATIFNHLHSSGLTIPCGPDEGWTRVLVEKPFGRDAKTAEKLDFLLAKLFKEEQIFRIDHYLAKEMLQNILSFRFSNNLFEQSWNNKFIEKVEIRLLEKIGVEGRGPFYDGLGALIDVGQNHLLQMLALVTMDHPKYLTSDVVRSKRKEILKTLIPLTSEDVKISTFRAQYKNYRKVDGVSPRSNTETYFKIKTFLNSSRWQGVPFYMESGKRLKEQIKEVVVTFKHVTPCLCPPGKHFTNKVIFSVEPQEGIKILFLAKKPGLGSQVEVQERNFNFIYRKKSKKTQYVEEYEKLLLDCITGNQLLFLSTAEVSAMWNFIDPIVSGWKKNSVPLQSYNPDTNDILKKAEQAIQKKEQAEKTILKYKEVGIVGLGKMGANLAKQLIEKDWRVVGYNRTKSVTQQLEQEGLIGAYSIEDFVKKNKKPRTILMNLPQGKPTDEVIGYLIPYLDKGDIIIDSANAFYKDTLKRSKKLFSKKIKFVDVGISGGPSGARYGASLMVGGDKETYKYLLPLFLDLAVSQGVAFFEGVGAGHFVKMVHNGIEYGMMQAIAEGFTILKKAKYRLDLNKAAQVYSKGTVIESRLVDWLKDGLQIYGVDIERVSGTVGRLGTGDWTVETAKELNVKAKIIEGAVKFRIESERNPSYTGKLLNVMRNMFGGHGVTGKSWRKKYLIGPSRGGRT